jgi:phospholipid-binding lipoprotein MlaA
MGSMKSVGWRLRVGGALVAALLAAGCATPPADPEAVEAYNEANDPLEPMNRAVFDLNQGFDRNLLKPAAIGYRDLFPDGFRASVNNALHNLRSPVIFANDILQGEGGRAAETLMRFAVNSVLGFAGLFDVAGGYGMERHSEDFGQTLAVWGFDEGFYLMLPVFGPSNPRDAVGLVVDGFIDPFGYIAPFAFRFTRSAVEGIDKREGVLEVLDELERTSVDFYATVRSLYRQRRADEIRQGEPGANIPAPSISFEFLEEETPAEPVAGLTVDDEVKPTANEVSLVQ